jgi:hypothetical protein
MSRFLSATFMALTLALAVACGGGGSSGSGMTSPAATSVMATGAITGFGSIYVNGVHFQTTHAVIHKNGVLVDQSQLGVGEIARVQGTKDSDSTGDADSIDVDENIVGAIDTVDSANNMLTVLGQTVKINNGTSFSPDIQPLGIDGLHAGAYIRVCGTVDSSGNVVATRISSSTAGGTLQVIGPVSMLDSANHKFRINALSVDYSGATVEGFGSGQPANGDQAEVRGAAYDAGTTTLAATRVERMESEHEQAQGDHEIEREGLVTRFASATDFDVAGKPVTTTSATMYRGGTSSDLALNVKVEVEGSYDSDNVLVAQVIAFHHVGNVVLQSQVTAVDTTAGTLTLLGITVGVGSMTRLEDHAMDNDHMFNLGDINVGDVVGVVGYESPAGSGMLAATMLVRARPGSPVIVVGPYGTATAPEFTVFGVMVDGSAAKLLGANWSTLTFDEFNTQAAGKYVAVTGTLSGTTVQATAAKILAHMDHEGDD